MNDPRKLHGDDTCRQLQLVANTLLARDERDAALMAISALAAYKRGDLEQMTAELLASLSMTLLGERYAARVCAAYRDYATAEFRAQLDHDEAA